MIADPAIRFESVGKSYRIGASGGSRFRYQSLGERLTGAFTNPLGAARSLVGPPASDSFWALRDVSFEVAPGEVVGVIGRNGAGKSTLLKVLSQITKPTEGRITVRGRVGSLLEVGTGFHPELTGRENIFLNGAILGMSRGEVKRKFDEIVAFSEVERFLDTPVKQYSSGMYTRLAFAVAAHLDPEVLVVDEVLAVGDAQFQKKCLGKMKDVAAGGRTVLFVSHNMNAVLGLCSKAVVLGGGRTVFEGEPDEAIDVYLGDARTRVDQDILERTDRGGDGSARFEHLVIAGTRKGEGAQIRTGGSVRFDFVVSRPVERAIFAIYDLQGRLVADFDTDLVGDLDSSGFLGNRRFGCTVDPLLLIPGTYYINIAAKRGGVLCDHVENAAELVVEEGMAGQRHFGVGLRGVAALPHRWID